MSSEIILNVGFPHLKKSVQVNQAGTVGEFGVFQDPNLSWQNQNGKQKKYEIQRVLRWFFIHISENRPFSLHAKKYFEVTKTPTPFMTWLQHLSRDSPAPPVVTKPMGRMGMKSSGCRGLHGCCLGGIASEDRVLFPLLLLYTCGFLGYKVKIAGYENPAFWWYYQEKMGEFSWVHELLVSGRVWELRWG